MEKSQKNIIIIILSLIIAVSASIAYFNFEISEGQKQLIINHKQNRVNILQTVIDERFSLDIAIIEGMLSHSITTKFSETDKIDPQLNGIPEFVELDQRSELRQLLQKNPKFESVGLFLPNGDIYLAEPFSSQLNLPKQNYAFRDWYRGAMMNNGIYISEPYETHYTNEITIALSAPIHDPDGKIIGIFHTTLQLDFLRELVDVQLLESQTELYFVDENGNIGIGTSNNKYDEEFFSKLISTIDNNDGNFQEEFFGTEHLIVYKVLDIENKKWFLFLIQPSTQAFATIVSSQYLTQSLLIVSIIVIAGFGFMVFRQNTKNIMIQKHLEKANKKLSTVDKEKGEFSAMITHELKTPLVPILGHAKMLSKKGMIGTLNEEQLDSVKVIEKNAKRLEKLISDIMDSRKLELGKMKFDKGNISIDDLFSDIELDYQNILNEKNIDFTISNETKDITIKSDKSRLRQVFDNLISNAVKFVPDTGGKITVGATKEDNYIQFYVKDNGTGIPLDKQEKLFHKFYQVDTSHTRKVQGTGLGLVICKGIVKKMGGKIRLESDGKSGTTFYFRLPLYV